MYSVKNDSEDGKLTIYCKDNLIGSFTYFYRIEEKNLELNRLFVNFSYRNKGYALKLISEMIKYSRQIGAKYVTANLDPEPDDCYNTIAMQNGFKPNNYHSFNHLDESEIEKYKEEAKKLMRDRKKQLMHLFETSGFIKWNEGNKQENKKPFGPNPNWVILHF